MAACSTRAKVVTLPVVTACCCAGFAGAFYYERSENKMSDKKIMFGAPEEDVVELTEHRAIIGLPEDSVSVEIRATVYKDNELVNVTKVLSMSDLRTAFRKADEGYIDDDDTFVLTDKGMAYLDEISK